jgi:peptidyl-prolyl cis-trans isomerase D
MEKARVLAEQSANELAAQVKKKGDALKDTTFEGYRVITLPAITRRQSLMLPNQFDFVAPEETPIPDVPYPGESFRNAYFDLQAGSTAVASNQPRTVFYVMTLDRREPATFAALYAPNGDESRYKRSTQFQAGRQLDEEWMTWLRRQAGLKPDWVPPDEKGRATDEDT